MSKTIIVISILLAAGLGIWYARSNRPAPTTPASKDDLITVNTPLPGSTVSSPLVVSGKARGTWYFEASFPVKLIDANGNVLAQLPAQAQGDWMTTDYVPFSVTIPFPTPATATGKLILEKDNPSGLPENNDELSFEIKFAEYSTSTQTASTKIKLYYYNPSLDQGPGGAQCGSQGLVAVDRTIPKTSTPLKDSIELLLKGELSSGERAQGIATEFPLAGVTLTEASITNGVATLKLNDPQNKTGGGSCRVSILRAEIEATAKQFPTVQSVRILPEELFQP